MKPAYDSVGALDLANSIYINWGAFITAIINFILVANFFIFYLLYLRIVYGLNYISGLSACQANFQRLVPNLTVYKNLSLVLNNSEKINAILQKVRLSEKANEYPRNLSGGQAQRAGLARAFLAYFSLFDFKIKIIVNG